VPTHPALAGVPILAAGVDWLTMTSRSLADEIALLELGARLIDEERQAGNDQRDLSIQGYRGSLCGGAFVGHREDGAMLRLSGYQAQTAWKDALGSGGVVTRLDVQVTAGGGDLCTDLAIVHREEARERRRRRGRPFDIRVDATDQKGQTLYLGGRQSDVYQRCYDKHAEEPRAYPPGAWRYETELKGDRAGATARAIYDQARATSYITSFVHDSFERRGVHPIFAPDVIVGDIRPHRQESSAERRLRWLREHVGVTFARVARESGLDAAIDAISQTLLAVEGAKINTAPKEGA
jgi:Replication initiation factor